MVGLGYNAIGTDIEGHIKGNLTLTSLQDNGTSSSNSASAGMSGTDVNIGASKGSGNYEQTIVSSIFGTGSVDLTVDGKLSLTGSSIANVDLDDKGKPSDDKGNLNLSLGSFEFTDLKDYMEDDQVGLRVGASSNTTSFGITKTGYEREGTTYATIGKGSITIGDGSGTDGLNRDILNNQVITTDHITGVLDGDVTLDNRVFTPRGWTGNNGIINDIEEAIDFWSYLNPVKGADKFLEELGLVPHPAINIWQELDEPQYDENGNVYFVVDPNEFIAITGQQVGDQEGINKIVYPVTLPNGSTEYRMYVSNPRNADSSWWSPSTWFKDIGNGRFGNLFPGITGTSQIHDVIMQRLEHTRGEAIGFPELVDTGIGTFFRNAYYSFGTGIRMLQGNQQYHNQYERQTGSNVVVRTRK